MIVHLIPAYGRDYRSKKAIIEDFNKDWDFLVANLHDPYDGKPVCKSELNPQDTINVRYQHLTKVAVFKVEDV